MNEITFNRKKFPKTIEVYFFTILFGLFIFGGICALIFAEELTIKITGGLILLPVGILAFIKYIIPNFNKINSNNPELKIKDSKLYLFDNPSIKEIHFKNVQDYKITYHRGQGSLHLSLNNDCNLIGNGNILSQNLFKPKALNVLTIDLSYIQHKIDRLEKEIKKQLRKG